MIAKSIGEINGFLGITRANRERRELAAEGHNSQMRSKSDFAHRTQICFLPKSFVEAVKVICLSIFC